MTASISATCVFLSQVGEDLGGVQADLAVGLAHGREEGPCGVVDAEDGVAPDGELAERIERFE